MAILSQMLGHRKQEGDSAIWSRRRLRCARSERECSEYLGQGKAGVEQRSLVTTFGFTGIVLRSGCTCALRDCKYGGWYERVKYLIGGSMVYRMATPWSGLWGAVNEITIQSRYLLIFIGFIYIQVDRHQLSTRQLSSQLQASSLI
jgi:hypothetical protein